ncbi:MAG: hypothetical protein PUF37_06370, partial [Prevotellaceae bacterium]|nr:hypothetical protein [Prevotellaceae bacterium]
MDIPASLVKRYSLLERKSNDPLYTYNIYLYKGLVALAGKKAVLAEQIFRRLSQQTPVNNTYVRHHYIAMSYEAAAMWQQGKKPQAIALMREAETIARKYDIKDML